MTAAIPATFKPKAIPTVYSGVSMRSRFEADAARWLDLHKIGWAYEPQSYLLNTGNHYLPDFQLPALGAWLECRGYLGRDEQLVTFGERCADIGQRFIIVRWDQPAEITGPWKTVGAATVRVCPGCATLYFDSIADHGCVGCGSIGEQPGQVFGATAGRLYPDLTDALQTVIASTAHLEPEWAALNDAPEFDIERFWELKDEADAIRETYADSSGKSPAGGNR
jgi:hypothetical protein